MVHTSHACVTVYTHDWLVTCPRTHPGNSGGGGGGGGGVGRVSPSVGRAIQATCTPFPYPVASPCARRWPHRAGSYDMDVLEMGSVLVRAFRVRTSGVTKSNLPGRPSVLWCKGRHEPTTACTALCASVDGPVVIGISSNRPCPSNQPPSSPSQPGFTPDNVFVCFCTQTFGSLSCIDTRGRLLQPGDPVAYTGPQGRAVLVPTTPTPAPVSSLLASLQDVKGWSQPV